MGLSFGRDEMLRFPQDCYVTPIAGLFGFATHGRRAAATTECRGHTSPPAAPRPVSHPPGGGARETPFSGTLLISTFNYRPIRHGAREDRRVAVTPIHTLLFRLGRDGPDSHYATISS